MTPSRAFLTASSLVVSFALAPLSRAQSQVFTDTFAASTVNSGTPAAPTVDSTAYQLFSSKTWSPDPAIASGHFQFGIAPSSSGHIETHALFSATPVALSNPGDFIQLTTTFTDTSGLLTQNGILGFGLYNSGGTAPLAGGLNGTATNGTAGVTGGAKDWQGYVNRLAFNAGNHRLATRPAQSLSTGNNQDLVTEGSGSQSYAGGVNLASVASSLTLVAGNQYTHTLTITLTATGTLSLDGALYAGSTASGTALYTQSATGVSGGNFLTASFDALALGWRATSNTAATAIDIQSFTVTSNAVAGATPVFTVQPASQTVGTGASVTFTAAASGSPTYQWRKDGIDLPGATSASYSIASASSTDAGSFTVVATNASGSTTSAAATLTVSAASGPAITAQPAAATADVGASVSFTVTATGIAPLSYQWQRETNGVFADVSFIFPGNDPSIITDYSGSATATLHFSHAQVINAGTYRVLVTDSTGTTASTPATFTVNATPVGALAMDGYAASVTGGGALTPVVVTTASALKAATESSSPAVITVSGIIDLGTNGRIGVKSNKTIRGADTGATILGTLSLSGANNVLIANLNISARTGERASNDGITIGGGSSNVLVTKCTIFDCTDGNLDDVNGSDNVTVSWCKFYYTRNTTHNFSNLVGSADDDNGPTGASTYHATWHHNWWADGCKQRMLADRYGPCHMFNNYWNCVGNDYCTASRNVSQMLSENNYYDGVKSPLTKENSGLLKTFGVIFNNCTGTQITSDDIVFTPPYSYQLDASSSVPAIVKAGAGNVSTPAPAVPSANITGDSSAAVGGDLTLSVTAAGFSPSSYQWRFKNSPIAGATSATFVLANAQLSDAGVYSVMLGLPGGSDIVVSPAFAVSIAAVATHPPVIIAGPGRQIVNVGTSASFTVTASGDAPLTYQWQKDNSGTFSNIIGATSSTLTFASAQSTDAGSYRAIVTNNAGSATSSAASLTVNPNFGAMTPDGFAATVTGGGSATPVVVSDAPAFKAAAEASGPAVITVSGTLDLGGSVAVKSDKTIQGADGLATLIGCLDLGSGGVNNVLIRGLNITNPGASGTDGITVHGASNVFITHCTVFDCANGLIDIDAGSDKVTVSWCEFYYTTAQTAHRFAMTIGSSTEAAPLHVTLHHNAWSDRCDERMPSANFGLVHLYNNYLTATANSSATKAGASSQFFVERSLYVGVKDPLSKENGGLIRSVENVFTNTTGLPADAGSDAVFTPPYSYKLFPITSSGGLDVATLVTANAGNTAGLNSASPALASASIAGPSAGGSADVKAGASLTLTASATGFTAGTYQWRLNNFPLAGATSPTFTLVSMAAENAGLYTVAISTDTGETVISAPFTVTLGAAVLPSITTQPASTTVAVGATASFTVAATGDAPLSYQWRKDGVALAGATSATYSISNAITGYAGAYSVVVSNSAGSVTSNNATLTVTTPPAPPPASGGGGGGGAPSWWFLASLGFLGALRRTTVRREKSRAVE